MHRVESQKNFAPHDSKTNPMIKNNMMQNNAIRAMFKKFYGFSSRK
jgi:hypothetical protein